MALVAISRLGGDRAEVRGRVRCKHVERIRKAKAPCSRFRPHAEIHTELIDQVPLTPTDRSSKRSNGHLSVRLIKRSPRPS